MLKIKVRIEEMVDDSYIRIRNVDMILDDEALDKIAKAIASQQSFAPDAAKSWRCKCGFDMAISAVKCIACDSPRR